MSKSSSNSDPEKGFKIYWYDENGVEGPLTFDQFLARLEDDLGAEGAKRLADEEQLEMDV